MHHQNELVRQFKTALERLPSDDNRIVIRADRTPVGEHAGRFNTPAQEEIAAILVDCERHRRDIVIHRRDTQLQRISEINPSYDALQYPLIFWKGQNTFHIEIPLFHRHTGAVTGRRVSTRSYYAHQLMVRTDDMNFILKCRSLLSQFAVDMFAKTESQRLRYLRDNQGQLRATEYIHLRDAIVSDGRNPNDIGQRIVLPSSFTGSPRHMHEYAQDAMAYVRKYGTADLFVTFTCNPDWPEIKSHLFPGQMPSYRHDITSRVFRLKLLKLIDTMTKFEIFGPHKCFMYTIEWQKRGLPHAHILIWLRDRIRPEQIDNVISAELPDPTIDPELFETVTKSMIHGPCGQFNMESPCMDRDRGCTKRYPRRFVDETRTGDDGYPEYRRRSPAQGGISFERSVRGRTVPINNTWVVPYSPLLCKMFNAHINVEYCHSVKSIKYICKYINKGSDMVMFEVGAGNGNDEITQYQMGRYLSTNEAFWRLFDFPIHDRYPAVFHLHVHLENGQRVHFNPSNAEERANADPPRTTLTAFFELCAVDAFARTLLYTEVVEYYTWNQSGKRFKRRARGSAVSGHDDIRSSDAIGRLYTVHPSQSECFFLRLLLTKVRGPTSFQDLRTHEGFVCATYREACLRRGLLEDDSHWRCALREAATNTMAPQMRDLFCVIVTAGEPTDPAGLWDLFKESLSDDILARQRRENPTLDLNFTDAIFNQALILIEDLCYQMVGKINNQLGLPAPNRSAQDVLNSDIVRETNYDRVRLRETLDSDLPRLTNEQASVFNTITEAISSQSGGIFFLDAPGGTGKTFLINLILAKVRADGDIILAVASSGIASTLLAGGRTAHSAFKLPLNMHGNENPMCAIHKGSNKAALLQECKAIIWDECTMSHRKHLEALDRTLRDIRTDQRVMGGIVLLLAGDFRQTLPVIPRGTPADELGACLKRSSLWPSVRRFSLTNNMRVLARGEAGGEEFCRRLLSIGEGTYPTIPPTITIRLDERLCQVVPNKEALIEKVFPNISCNFSNPDWLRERAILAPKNDMATDINLSIQERLTSQEVRVYYSVDEVVDVEQAVNYPVEFLNSLRISGLPDHELILRVGSPIMLLRNLNPPKLCNGTRLIVTGLHRFNISAVILSGPYQGDAVIIPRIPLLPNDSPIAFKRKQFPVRLAYAMTINKSQGQSLEVVGIDLSVQCFSHGQLYVACSRVGSPRNIFVYTPESLAKNVVYPAALT